MEEPQDLSFEESYRELGEVVQQLEAGDLSLDRSMALFERGMQLAKLCENKLDQAEQRVVQIMEAEDGAADLAPFAGRD
jgi:exodeoxyribonuclease VII small subunit